MLSKHKSVLTLIKMNIKIHTVLTYTSLLFTLFMLWFAKVNFKLAHTLLDWTQTDCNSTELRWKKFRYRSTRGVSALTNNTDQDLITVKEAQSALVCHAGFLHLAVDIGCEVCSNSKTCPVSANITHHRERLWLHATKTSKALYRKHLLVVLEQVFNSWCWQLL